MATDAAIADALAGRFGPIAVRYRFEQRSHNFEFEADVTTAIDDCAIDLDNFRAITRTAAFTLRPARLPGGFTDDSHIGVFAELIIAGETVRWPLGLFKLDTVMDEHSPAENETWNIRAADVSLHLFENYTQSTYVVPAGTRITTRVQEIMQANGLQNVIEPSNKTTTIDQVWAPRTAFGQIANDLLESINFYKVWADGQGVIRSRPNLDPFTETPDIVYTTFEEPRMVHGGQKAFTHTRGRAQYLNQAVIRVEDPLQTSQAVIVTNDDVDSRISTVSKGVTTSQNFNGDRLDCQDCRAEYGRNVLRQVSVESQKAILQTRIDPRREAHEHYQLFIEGTEQDEIGSRWRVLGWSLDCNPDAPGTTMLHTIGRATELTLTTQEVA